MSAGMNRLYMLALDTKPTDLESQVTICPDPNDSSSLLSTPGPEQAVAASVLGFAKQAGQSGATVPDPAKVAAEPDVRTLYLS